MKRKSMLILVVGFALLTVLPGHETARGQGGNTLEAYIIIGKDNSGACVVKAVPVPIRSAKRNFRVIWHVTNYCDGTQEVTVSNFKHRQDNNRRKDPLDFGSAPDIPSGQTREVEGRVKPLPQEDLGTYKYDILINGIVAEDPELEIDG